jgi:hypothetical protein
MLRELESNEQQRMTVAEAGMLYDGYFIFFTNSEGIVVGSDDVYAVPRVISLTSSEFAQSGLYEKYRNQSIYGTPFFCSFFVSAENAPPILSF